METVFTGAWAGVSCTRSTIESLLVVVAVILGVLLLIAGIAWLIVRRTRQAATPLRGLVLILGGAAAVSLAIGLYVVFLDGPVYRHIAFGNGLMVFDGCSGFRPVREELADAEVEGVHYRARWTAGRKPRLIDEIVVTTRGRGEFQIPLSVDPATTNHGALRRLLPASVMDDYAASLRSRRVTPPAALAAP